MAGTTQLMNEEQQGGITGFGNRVVSYPQRLRQFLHEVRVELRNVNWPTWDDVKTTTVVVIITVFVFGAFFFVVDQGASRLVRWIFAQFKS